MSPKRNDDAQIRPFCCCTVFAPLSHEIAASPTQCPTPNAFHYHFARTSQAKSRFFAATSATRKPKMTQEAPRWRLGAPRWPPKGPVQSATNTVLPTKSKRYFHDLPDLAQPQSFEGSPKPFAHFYLLLLLATFLFCSILSSRFLNFC